MKKLLIAVISLLVFLSGQPDVFGASQISILAPDEDSFIGQDQLLVIGTVKGNPAASRIDVSDNGRSIGTIPVNGGTFVLRIHMDEGLHEIVFSIPGGEARTLKVFVGKQEGYRYHIRTDTDSCGDCHREASQHKYGIGPMQAEICLKCHEPMGTSEYVHGPVAAGSCTPCHDPHGSRHDKFLLAAGKELCLTCHDQNLSKKHVEERQNAQCIKCHDPHGSNKKYHLR